MVTICCPPLCRRFALALGCLLSVAALAHAAQTQPIAIDPPHVSTDASVQISYPIVYTRSPRTLPCTTACPKPGRWAEFSNPTATNPGTDLMLLRPDGTEEVLVAGGAGAIQDPMMSIDGAWVYYTRFHVADLKPNAFGSDIYKLHLHTRVITRLTTQTWATNKGLRPPQGVYNMHPCPTPGGRVVYTSNRNGYLPPLKSFPDVAWQLHAMDEDGANVETIGPMNLAGALHPTLLTSGKVMFSTLENMGIRHVLLWGIWEINPDGTNWGPVMSAYVTTHAPPGLHFQTQLSDGRKVIEQYYNQNQKGFGSFFAVPAPPTDRPAYGPADIDDPRNPRFKLPDGRNTRGKPFSPAGLTLLTPWAWGDDLVAMMSDPTNLASAFVGKVTHPSGAPQNHLLLVWTLGAIGTGGGGLKDWMQPQPIDSGLYLLKDGQPTESPSQLRLIKNDPNYNEQWPRAAVPYAAIYGADPPVLIASRHPILAPGVPAGLIGTSSMYKRDSAPLGRVPAGEVTAVSKWDWQAREWNWVAQGSDAGQYTNAEIHAIRILTFEPNAYTPGPAFPGRKLGFPHFTNVPMERLRILGEIPVRKWHQDGSPVLDPDGNPDTSFLARMPADVPFTFQTIDRDGLALNMAQTWHQVRPGEARMDCGGCHAHSQPPTLFEETAAARPDYVIPDLTVPGLATVYTRAKHVPKDVKLDFDHRAQVTPLQARCSPGYWLLAGRQYPCPGVTPLPAETVLSDHKLSPEELGDLARLIDTGSTWGPAAEEDATKPTLTVSWPMPGTNVGPLDEVRLGMHDLTGLDMATLRVTLDGIELGDACKPLPDWRWRCPVSEPLLNTNLARLVVAVKDTSGNQARIERTFAVVTSPPVVHLEGQWDRRNNAVACTVEGRSAQGVLDELGQCMQ